jgi:hypothetical protein
MFSIYSAQRDFLWFKAAIPAVENRGGVTPDRIQSIANSSKNLATGKGGRIEYSSKLGARLPLKIRKEDDQCKNGRGWE